MPRPEDDQGAFPAVNLELPIGAGRQVIQAYGDGGFRIAGTAHAGSVLVFPEHTEPWPVTDAAGITFEALRPVVEAAEKPDLLLIGCGASFGPPPTALRDALRDVGIALEWIDTGAACRTFNLLLAEDRRIAAALIAVD
jgi:uncharacterized protein